MSKMPDRTQKSRLYCRISAKRAKGVTIDPGLCFYNTKEVLEALRSNRKVLTWLRFIGNHYVPSPHDVLLIYPCSADKPYYKSRSYAQLFKTLSYLGEDRERIQVATVSEPFGLVPEDFYGKKTEWHDWRDDWYDCPGLFRWWCSKYGTSYSSQEANECIEVLSRHIALFLRKVASKRCYRRIIAFVRTYSSNLAKTQDQTHRRMLEKAREYSGVHFEILPTRNLVSSIVQSNGKYAWDMYGVSHPKAQRYLLQELRSVMLERASL